MVTQDLPSEEPHAWFNICCRHLEILYNFCKRASANYVASSDRRVSSGNVELSVHKPKGTNSWPLDPIEYFLAHRVVIFF